MKKSFEYKKSLGQNFLIDNNIIDKIISLIENVDNSLVIEVGPGSGSLTKRLVETNNQILCFEIDNRLKEELDKINSTKLEIIYEDFLKCNIKKYTSKYKYNKLYLVANLPYYITTPIVMKVLNELDIDTMIIMIQKEVAERFNAKPNTKAYNSLSVFLQYNFEITKVCDVSKNSFVPKPKVDSVVLKLKRHYKYKANDEEKFYKIVREAFRHKRKNIKNNLGGFDIKKLESTLISINKSLATRAEELTIEDFIYISNEIF